MVPLLRGHEMPCDQPLASGQAGPSVDADPGAVASQRAANMPQGVSVSVSGADRTESWH